MNQQEFIKQFEKINGRKPSPAELYQAIQDGRVAVGNGNLLRKRLLIGLGVAVIGVGSFYLYQSFQNHEPEKTEQVTSSKKKEATTTTTEVQTTTSTSSTTSSQTTEDSTHKMDIEALYKRDFSSIEGYWTNGQENIKLTDKLVGDVEVMQHEDGYVEYLVTESGVKTSRFGYFFFPAGTPTIDLTGAYVSNTDDTSKDRVLVMHEIYGSFYYRTTESASAQEVSMEGIRGQIEARVDQYREDINRSLATRTDRIAENFVPGSESHRVTVDWVVHHSENEGIASYDSTTDSISNIRVSGNTVTCDLSYTTITHYTDGRSPAKGHTKRHYVFKRTATGLLIEDFGGLTE